MQFSQNHPKFRLFLQIALSLLYMFTMIAICSLVISHYSYLDDAIRQGNTITGFGNFVHKVMTCCKIPGTANSIGFIFFLGTILLPLIFVPLIKALKFTASEYHEIQQSLELFDKL